MNKIPVFLLIIFCYSIADAQNFKIEIPIQYEQGHIIFEAELNDSGKKERFIFDTGGANILEKSYANTLTNKQDLVIDKFKMGDLIVKNKKFQVHDWGKKIGGAWITQFSGMIGPDIMKDYVWQINYQKRIMVITNHVDLLNLDKNTPSIPFDPIKLHMPKGSPEVTIQYGSNEPRKYIVDTGDEAGLTDYIKPYREALETKKIIPIDTFQAHTRGYHNKGDITLNFYIARLKDVKLGSFKLDYAELIISQRASIGMTIGNHFLQNYITTFDWPSRRIYLTPISNSNNYQCLDFVNKMKGND